MSNNNTGKEAGVKTLSQETRDIIQKVCKVRVEDFMDHCKRVGGANRFNVKAFMKIVGEDVAYELQDTAQSRIAELEAREEKLKGLLEDQYVKDSIKICMNHGFPSERATELANAAWQQYQEAHPEVFK